MGPFGDGWTIADVDAVIAKGDPHELLYVPIVASLSPPDILWAEAICIRLSQHPNWNVRGNAILGFGHLSRVYPQLNLGVVKPLIEAALHDEHPYVRGQASGAADDVEQFLGWKIEHSPVAQ